MRGEERALRAEQAESKLSAMARRSQESSLEQYHYKTCPGPDPKCPKKRHAEDLLLFAALLLLHLALVEGKLGALKDVPINAAVLARAARHARNKTASLHLVGYASVDSTPNFVPLLPLARDSPADLDSLGGFLAQLNTVVLLEPLAERRGIDLHNRVLHQRLGAHQLVVGGIVDDVEHTGAAGARLRGPGEVAVLKAQRPELGVAATHAHSPDALSADTGACRGAAQLVLPLLTVDRALATRRPALLE